METGEIAEPIQRAPGRDTSRSRERPGYDYRDDFRERDGRREMQREGERDYLRREEYGYFERYPRHSYDRKESNYRPYDQYPDRYSGHDRPYRMEPYGERYRGEYRDSFRGHSPERRHVDSYDDSRREGDRRYEMDRRMQIEGRNERRLDDRRDDLRRPNMDKRMDLTDDRMQERIEVRRVESQPYPGDRGFSGEAYRPLINQPEQTRQESRPEREERKIERPPPRPAALSKRDSMQEIKPLPSRNRLPDPIKPRNTKIIDPAMAELNRLRLEEFNQIMELRKIEFDITRVTRDVDKFTNVLMAYEQDLAED